MTHKKWALPLASATAPTERGMRGLLPLAASPIFRPTFPPIRHLIRLIRQLNPQALSPHTDRCDPMGHAGAA
ncbi:hypothetical protein MMMB2_1219 [Mycobacterium marinum MB2]|nr:hypothetical protein MMMB2_1219 [Mycobacterium marinum MB2]